VVHFQCHPVEFRNALVGPRIEHNATAVRVRHKGPPPGSVQKRAVRSRAGDHHKGPFAVGHDFGVGGAIVPRTGFVQIVNETAGIVDRVQDV